MRVPGLVVRSLIVAAAAVPWFPQLAGAARPPVDLTGTTWHTEGRIRVSRQDRSISTPTWLDVDFLPDLQFSAADPAGTILSGTYTAAGSGNCHLTGTCDPSSLDGIETTLQEELEAALATTVYVDTLSDGFRARTNRDATRLRVKVVFRFQIDLPAMGRTLRLRETVRTRGVR